MTSYGGNLNLTTPDALPWENKLPKMFFGGTSTGAKNPFQNSRVKACLWAQGKRVIGRPDDHTYEVVDDVKSEGERTLRKNIADFRISRLAPQTSPSDLFHVIGDASKDILSDPFPNDFFRRYRIALNIPGNTSSWARVPDILSSKSVLFDQRSTKDILWWSPLLAEGVHYVGVSPDFRNLETKFHDIVNSKTRCHFITESANDFAQDFLHSVNAAQYMRSLLENCATNGR